MSIFIFSPMMFIFTLGFPGDSVVKNLPANAEDAIDTGSSPGSGGFPEEMATHSSILAWRIPFLLYQILIFFLTWRGHGIWGCLRKVWFLLLLRFFTDGGNLVTKSCLILCNPIDGSPPGFSVHGTSQARILERVAISFSRRSCRPRDWTCVFCWQADSLPLSYQGNPPQWIMESKVKRKEQSSFHFFLVNSLSA